METSIDGVRRWWTQDDPAKTISGIITTLYGNSLSRLRDYRVGALLYGASDVWGPYVLASIGNTPLPLANNDRLRINVTQSAIDTLRSKIGKNKPLPILLTTQGNFKQQMEAEKLTALIDGVFAENRAYSLGDEVFRDGCVFGDGLACVGVANGRVRFERVPPWELFIDDIAAINSLPRQMHRVRLVERDELMARFPKHKKVIENAPNGQLVFPLSVSSNVTDLVELHESWRLPSAPDAEDGRYVASIGGLTVADSPWKRMRYPFARFTWCKRTGGFWGQGLAEQLKPIQLDINREAALLQKTHYRQTTFDVMVPVASKVSTDKLSNEVGNIVKFSGPQPPFSSSPALAQPERYRWVQWLIEKAYEISGVSQMAASSVIPAGMESGKAIRTLSDVGTDRFREAGKAYEAFFVELAELAIDAIEEHVTETKGRYPVKAPSWSGVDELDFKTIKLARDNYVVQCFPTSSLPSEPAGRMQEIEDMERRGTITPQTAQRLYDFADVQSETVLMDAAQNYARKVFAQMLDGEYTAPQPYDDLAVMLSMALQHYNLWRMQDAGEDALEMLRRFITEVQALQAAAMPPPPATTPMPVSGAAPSLAAPMPLPGPMPGPMPVPVA